MLIINLYLNEVLENQREGSLLGQEILDIRDRKLESIPRKSLKKITKEAILLCLDGKELASREIFRSLKG